MFADVHCLGPTNMAPIWLQKVGFENNRLLDPVFFLDQWLEGVVCSVNLLFHGRLPDCDLLFASMQGFFNCERPHNWTKPIHHKCILHETENKRKISSKITREFCLMLFFPSDETLIVMPGGN